MRRDPWETANLIDTGGLASEIRAHRKLLDDFMARMDPAPKRA